MNTPLIVENNILINAPIERVWDALVNPEITVQYMYGCVPLTDWKVGSPLLWEGEYEGQRMVFVKGQIVDFQPNTRMVYTVIDPLNPNIPDLPENYLTVVYLLSEVNGQTYFAVTQGDYSSVAEGQKRYDETVQAGGWQSVLEVIKKVLEEKA